MGNNGFDIEVVGVGFYVLSSGVLCIIVGIYMGLFTTLRNGRCSLLLLVAQSISLLQLRFGNLLVGVRYSLSFMLSSIYLWVMYILYQGSDLLLYFLVLGTPYSHDAEIPFHPHPQQILPQHLHQLTLAQCLHRLTSTWRTT